MGDEQSLIARDKQSSQKNEEIRHPSMQTTSGGRAWECGSTALLLAAVEELAAFGIFGAALASGMDQGGDTFLSDLRGQVEDILASGDVCESIEANALDKVPPPVVALEMSASFHAQGDEISIALKRLAGAVIGATEGGFSQILIHHVAVPGGAVEGDQIATVQEGHRRAEVRDFQLDLTVCVLDGQHLVDRLIIKSQSSPVDIGIRHEAIVGGIFVDHEREKKAKEHRGAANPKGGLLPETGGRRVRGWARFHERGFKLHVIHGQGRGRNSRKTRGSLQLLPN